MNGKSGFPVKEVIRCFPVKEVIHSFVFFLLVTTVTTPKPIDKLSDISFELKVSRGSKIDEYIVSWTVSVSDSSEGLGHVE